MNLFVITSAINPIKAPVNGNNIRSLFTVEERCNQTLVCLENIRKLENTFCLLVDATDIPENIRQIIEQKVDKFLDLSKDEMYRFYSDSNDKSLGETVSLYKAIVYILENNIVFERLFKICGRFHINNNFTLDNFHDQFVFKLFKNEYKEWYSTCLYMVPFKLRWFYLEILYKCILYIHRTRQDIETSMLYFLPKSDVCIKEIIGVSGILSSFGTKFDH